jgi:hypothetical protein
VWWCWINIRHHNSLVKGIKIASASFTSVLQYIWSHCLKQEVQVLILPFYVFSAQEACSESRQERSTGLSACFVTKINEQTLIKFGTEGPVLKLPDKYSVHSHYSNITPTLQTKVNWNFTDFLEKAHHRKKRHTIQNTGYIKIYKLLPETFFGEVNS